MKNNKTTSIDQERKNFVIRHLRRASIYWPHRQGALLRQKSGSSYLCESCRKFFQKGMVQVDHVEPAIELTGWDATKYIDRLLCTADKLQVLCKNCHCEKTKLETEQRTKIRRDRIPTR